MKKLALWAGPFLAAALGYWVVGPRLAGNPKLRKLVQEAKLGPGKALPGVEPSSDLPKAEDAASPGAETAPPPAVKVGVSRASQPEKKDEPKPRRRRRRRRTPPRQEVAAPPAPAPTPERTGPDPASNPDA